MSQKNIFIADNNSNKLQKDNVCKMQLYDCGHTGKFEEDRLKGRWS
jgi:hypothetical protein